MISFLSVILVSHRSYCVKLVAVELCLVFCIGCQTNGSTFDKDESSKRFVAQQHKAVSAGKNLSPEQFEKLKTVYEKYPTSDRVRETYRGALVKRTDWGALEKLLTDKPTSNLSVREKKDLANVYTKLGKFRKALELLKPLSDANPNDFELNVLAGLSYYRVGELETAAKHLNSSWDELVKNKKLGEMSILGIIYFRQNNPTKAIEVLDEVLEIDPNHITSNNVLSRIYSQKGEPAKAEKYRLKTLKEQEVIQNESFVKSKQVRKNYELEGAWKNKNYQEVISLSKEMIPNTADKNQKSILLQYLYKSYQALGMKTEAQDVLKQAQQLNQK